MKVRFKHFCCILFLLCAGSIASAAGKVDPRLVEELQHMQFNDNTLAWVFFADKGSHEVQKLSVPHSVVSQRSVLRRLKVRPMESAVDYTDLPVEQRYVEQIASRVQRVRQVSKWLNGVSVQNIAEDGNFTHVKEQLNIC